MMYLVELITTMTLVHNIEVSSVTSTEQPLLQSIVSNNNKKKSSETSSSKSKKTTSSSKKSPSKKSPTKKSPTKKTTTKSSSSSSKRPPPRPTTSRSSSTRPTSQSSSSRPSSTRTTSQSSTSRPTTKPSSRPSSSSSPQKSGHSSKSYSSTQSQRPSSRSIHPSQRSISQSKTSQSTAHKNATSQKVKSVHQNQSRVNVPKKSAQPKTSSGTKVHPSYSKSKVKKPSSDISKSSKSSQNTNGGRSPNLSQEQLRERREALQNKKPKTTQPEEPIHDTRPPKHKPKTVPNRGSRYDSTMDRGNTGNRITPSSSKGKDGLINGQQQGNSRVNNQDINDRRNNRNQDGFSTNRNTGPVVIVVEKPSSTPDGWNPEIHRQSSEENRHWHPNYWGAGVFYYTEPPQNVYVEEHNYYGDTVRKYEAPKRKCDRRKSLSVGLRGGTLGSQVEDFSQDDISWGGAVGYRLFDPIGLEVSYIKTGDEWTTGLKAPAQVSGNLYLFPWTGVSPYITGGISVAEQAGAKNQTDFELPDGYAYGPHGGGGIEWGIGNHISLNAEGRFTKFQNVDATHTQLSAGINFYF